MPDEHTLIGGSEQREIVLAEYNPAWPAIFARHAAVTASMPAGISFPAGRAGITVSRCPAAGTRPLP